MHESDQAKLKVKAKAKGTYPFRRVTGPLTAKSR